MPAQLTRGYHLRIARPDDLAGLDALFGRAYPRLLKADYPPSVMVTAVPLIARAQPRLLASGTFYVVESEGRLIGAGGWTRRDLPELGDIRHVVCDDRHLRRGVARMILTRCIEEATAAGLRLLDCKATRTAVPFYAAMGFEVLGPMAVPLAPGILFPAVRMARGLLP